MQHRDVEIRRHAAQVLVELAFDDEAAQLYLAETFGFTPVGGKVCLNSIPVKIQALLRERPELLRLLRSDDHSNGKFWSFPPFSKGPKTSAFPDPQEFIIGFTCAQARKKLNGSFRIEAPTFPEAKVRPSEPKVNLNLDTTTSFYSDSPNSRSTSAERATPERRRPVLGDNSPQMSLTLERRKDLEALKEPLSHSPNLYSKVRPEYSAAPVEVRSPRAKATAQLPPRTSASPRPSSAVKKDAYLTTIEASLKRIKGALAKAEKTRTSEQHSPSPSATSRAIAIGRHSPYQRKQAATSASPLRMKNPESVVLNILKQQRNQVTTMVRQSITSPRRSPLSTTQRLRTAPGKYTDRPIFKV